MTPIAHGEGADRMRAHLNRKRKANVMTDYDKLRELAQQATRGPWTVDYAGDFGNKSAILADVLRETYGRNALDCGEDHATAEYIAAANPATVLALLDELRNAKIQAWDECSAALGRWGEAGWDWEHGYINEIPPKPTNPYREDPR